ncbi:hypothetical protein OY671_010107, partial [Metschnikowia pulcherrima]
MLKGVREPHQVWRVQGSSRTASRFEAATGAGSSPSVGRQQESASSTERWQLAAQGQGQVVQSSGEAGIGKSRMVSESRQRMGNAGSAALSVQCSPQHRHAEFHPSREGSMRRLEIRHGMSSAVQRERSRDSVSVQHGSDEVHAQASAELSMSGGDQGEQGDGDGEGG